MSTATAIRTQEKTGTWASIFTNEQVTEQQSALFVKKLLAVAISNITYLRAIFPERAFGDRCLEDLNLKILRDDSSCPGACQVIKWIKGCFDALDKKYLRQLIIGIYIDPNDLDTVIESYTLKFFYTKEGGIDIYRDEKKIASAYTASETKKATIKLIRTIVVLTHTLKPLPEDVMMTIKLLYYDEVTPADYEPPGFKPSEHDSFNFAEEPINLKLGDVSTPFHTVKMRIKTDKSQFEMKETIEEEVENETECKKISNDSLDKENGESNMSENVRKLSEDYVPVNGHYTTDAVSTSSSAKSEEDCSKNQTMTVTQGENVRCPCGCNEDDGLMILCGVCKYWQHAVCFLITKEEEAPSVHVCDVCAEPGNPEKEPTDSFLVGCSSIVIQATCLWRRALITCSEISRVLPPAFARRLGIEMTVAQGLINRLEKEGYIKNPVKGKRLGKPVNKEKLLNEGIPKYFKKKPISSCNVKSSTKSKKMEVSESQNIVEVSDTEVDNLTERTKDITLFGKKKKSLKSRKSLEETKIKTNKSDAVEKNPAPNKDTETFARETRSRKRALSVTDTETEFDICHSQDTTSNEGSKQRKKSSIADNAILV